MLLSRGIPPLLCRRSSSSWNLLSFGVTSTAPCFALCMLQLDYLFHFQIRALVSKYFV